MKKFKICLITSTFLIATSLVMTSCTNKENPTTSNTIQNEDTKENESQSSDISLEGEKATPDKEENDTQGSTTPSEKEKSNSTNNNSNESSTSIESLSKEKEQKSKIPYPTFNNINNKDKGNQLVLSYIKELENLYSSNDGISLELYKLSDYVSK